MDGDLGHAGKRTDYEIGTLGADAAERQRVDVDQTFRRLDFLAHEVDEGRAACYVACTSCGRFQCIFQCKCFLEHERTHVQPLLATSAIAATMPGYAPHRQ